MEKGLLIIMSGPSGVGKGTIRLLVMADKSLNMTYSISMTTRKPREFEKEGRDYFFVSQEEFNQYVKEGRMLEHADYVDHSYGTPKDYVEKLRNEGKNVLLEIDVKGAKQVLGKEDGLKTVSFFIVPPSLKELERRIRSRGSEDEGTIAKRMAVAKAEIANDKLYDYIVLNDNVQTAADLIRTTVLSIAKAGGKKPDQPKAQRLPAGFKIQL